MSLHKSARLEIRVSPAERAAWAEAAGGTGRTSEWLRSLANQAAATFIIAEDPLPAKAAPVAKTKGAQCPRQHHHRPGAYCGSCREVSAK